MPFNVMRERVAFEKKVDADDSYGNSQGDFVAQFQRFARIEPKMGGETVMAARLTGREPVTVTVRYDSQTKTVDTDWQMRDLRSGKVYNIRAVSNTDERKRYLEMTAEAGVAT